jgi:1,2-phenylacetyl-CoA epoxidase PaaB subunit
MNRSPPKKTAATNSSSRPPKTYIWVIRHIKGTPAKLLGTVEAPDEETAITKAIAEFRIDPALQNRITAERQR